MRSQFPLGAIKSNFKMTSTGSGDVRTPPSGFSQVPQTPPFLAHLFMHPFCTCDKFIPRPLKVTSPGQAFFITRPTRRNSTHVLPIRLYGTYVKAPKLQGRVAPEFSQQCRLCDPRSNIKCFFFCLHVFLRQQCFSVPRFIVVSMTSFVIEQFVVMTA